MSGKLVHVMIIVVLAAGLAQAAPGSATDPNLVGWWRFDEGSGAVAADSGGLGMHGTLVNGPEWRDDGPRKGCLFFDGYDDYVQVANQASLNPGAGSFTMTLWANVDPAPGTRGDVNWDLALAKRDTGSAGYYVGANRTQGGGAGRTGWRFMSGDTAATRVDTPVLPVLLGEWAFIAAVMDREQNVQKISVDGGLNWATITPPTGPIAPARDLGIGWDIGMNNFWFRGKIDDVAFFDRALSDGQVKRLMEEGVTPALAEDLEPRNFAVDVPADVVLSWSPGLYAATHDVYLGTDEADVAAADRASPLDVLVSQGQADATFDPGRLTLGQTYYWRVDEVNSAPDSTIFKGDVWYFEVEPVGYPIAAELIEATASSSSTVDEGPANTIGGVGLNPDDLHSVDATQMWLSGSVAPGESASIQYRFDKMYALHQMLVWNHNTQSESVIGFGIQEAIVEYSLDGSDWKTLGDRHIFNQATGKDDYAANTAVDFGGVVAKYVRITAVSNWKGLLQQYGLSEVRFLYLPVRARQPNPASGATDVVPAMLSWRAGRRAAQHDVYISTDEQAVVRRTTASNAATRPSFDLDALDLGQTYYWRVDEVNLASAVAVWESDVWNFSTPQYIVVEDFESYTDAVESVIYKTWTDGWDNGTGSQVGYDDVPYAEMAFVNSGHQAMPVIYSNVAPQTRSEAQRFFDEPQDWTQYGIRTLVVHFRGDLDNTGQLYVKINDTKKLYDGDPADLKKLVYQRWDIDLSTVNVSLGQVSSLTIGVEGADATGILYVDDIWLCATPLERERPVEPDRAHLIACYTLDGNTDDSSGNGYHGTAVGGPLFVSGVQGQAMQFDGADDHVRIVHQNRLNPGTGSFTITCWALVDTVAGTAGTVNWDLAVAKRETSSARGYYLGALRTEGSLTQTGWKFMLGDTTGTRVDTPFVPVLMGEWAFVAGVLDRDQNVHKISVDGGHNWASARPPAGTITPSKDLAIGWDIGQNNYWFRGMVDEVRLYDRALTDLEIAWLAGAR